MPQIEAIQERARWIRLLATPAQLCAMSLPAAYLSRILLSPFRPRTGACSTPSATPSPYMLALPPARGERCQRWRQATELILAQADVAAVSHQIHLALALFYDAQLDIAAMD
jgi:hypothetical protein